MKYLMFALVAVMLASGCSTPAPVGVGAPVRDIPVLVSSEHTLDQAILSAAARRRWTPQKTSNTTYRLSFDSRGHHVVVDVVMAKESFSILPVDSNVPTTTYDKWVNNLQREISVRTQKVQ